MRKWIIKNANGECWSNEHGWVQHSSDADVFEGEDKLFAQLPIDGKWVELDETPQTIMEASNG